MSEVLAEARRTYLAEGAPLVEKYKSRINDANKFSIENGGKPLNIEKQIALARVVENTNVRLGYALREATQNWMIGPYKRYATDMLTVMFPNLIAFDVVNVQPMSNKSGMVNYVKYSAGSTHSSTMAGDEIATPFAYTGADVNYTAQTVSNQPLVVQQTSGTQWNITLPWRPVIMNSVHIKVGDGASAIGIKDTGVQDGGGNYTIVGEGPNASAVSGGTINYASGTISVTFTTAPGAVDTFGTWAYNNEYAPVDVPELNISIESVPILAKSRKLKALWSFDAAFEMEKEYGENINTMLAAAAAQEIAQEIDREILGDLYDQAFVNAANPVITWDSTVPVGVAQSAHFESLKTAFQRASNRIYQLTKRVGANFAVVGVNVATVIESAPSFVPSGTLGGGSGAYFLGTWGGIRIYKNPFYDPNAALLGYKGTNFYDTGYIYAPYMPLSTTQLLMLADFQGQQGWATSYGKVMLNNMLYTPVRILNFD